MSLKRTRPLGPIKDPFFQGILRALEEVQIDPALFERAMGDLLNDAIPGLVPVSGGGDQGFDGSIADGKGEPYPLVCTTAKNIEANLRKSLRSYFKNGWSTRKAAFATSRRLTPGQRKKLRDIAREEGITLVQIFEQDALADRLARNERWCKELLGVSFRVRPLSAIPSSRRPLLEVPLVGREKDVEWLLKTPGDRILAGEPGSGKTFLLYHLIRRERWPALFLSRVEAGDDEIGMALRELRPKIVILDDAHTKLPLLDRLRHLRAGGSVPAFELVAATWRGGLLKVSQALGGLPENRIRQLELLSRDEIVEVMHSVGLDVNDELMRFLVDQASNRPGLAVTIASRALQGEWKALIGGDFLAQDLLAFFESGSGPEVRQVLAGLSLGGDRGMAWEDVAKFLGLDFPRVQGIVTDLAVGGVLREVEPERGVLAVWPRVFRAALLRSIFFSGGTSRSFRELLDKAPSFPKAVETILSAIERDGTIGRDQIRDLVMQAGSVRAWNQLGSLNEGHAKWVLENYPGDARSVAGGALEIAPNLAIRSILKAANEKANLGEKDRVDPFGPVPDWIEDLEVARHHPEQSIERRRVLAIAARDFLAAKGSPEIGLRAILLALSPNLRSSTLNPGFGGRVTFRHRILPAPQIEQLQGLWTLVRDAVSEIDSAGWGYLAFASWNWAFPVHAATEDIDSVQRQAIRDLGTRVVSDLAHLAHSSPGLSAGFAEIATRLGIELPIKRDPIFDLLFADLTGGDLAERDYQKAVEKGAVHRLAESWQAQGPRAAAERLAYYLTEGRSVGKIWNSNFGHLCVELADLAKPSFPWFEALVAQELEGAVVRPFLDALVRNGEFGWETALRTSLEIPALAPVALEIALRSDLPEELLALALAVAPKYTHVIRGMSFWGTIPKLTLIALLKHPSEEVSLAAAVGEWDAEPRGTVRPEVSLEWGNAIIRSKTTRTVGIGYLQEAILLSDPSLAAAWFAAQLKAGRTDSRSILGSDQAIAVAKSLRPEAKAEFLRSEMLDWSLVPALVDGSPELFRALLENPNRALHLRALAREPDEGWAELLEIAIDEGFLQAEIVSASYPSSVSWAGSGIPYYEARDAQLARFEHHPSPGVREVVSKLREQNSSNLEGERKRARDRELHGLVASE